MSELQTNIQQLYDSVQTSASKLQIDQKAKALHELEAESKSADFWNNSTHAQSVMKRIAAIRQGIDPWQQLMHELEDLLELAQMNDATMATDLQSQLTALAGRYDGLKKELRFSGPYDDHGVIISIYAGAGGTDAQDWAQMLERMYLRWFEQNNIKPTIVDRSQGEEAGIKSVTLEANGQYLYGKLKGEHGVHRLVRLSPFNADNLRQTSFAKVDILPKIDEPNELEIDNHDIKVDVYRAGGHGGQSVNTTDSAVRLTHIPTGISVAIQNERSQLQNKETAMTILRSRLAQLQIDQHKSTLADIKGPNTSAEWGSQIRNYVLHPYKQVKDSRSGYESSDPQAILDGKIDDLLEAYVSKNI